MNTEKSLGCSNRCRDIVILNLLGCQPPASWISLDLCNGPNSHEGRTASPCQISSNRLNRGRDMEIFQFFKMVAAAILDFWNLKFLTVRTLKRVELHHRTKFCRNRSNRGWDMTIFRFSRWRPPPSPSWINQSFTTGPAADRAGGQSSDGRWRLSSSSSVTLALTSRI